MLVGALLLSAAAWQDPAPAAAPTREQLAERFVAAATPEETPSLDDGVDLMVETLLQANPGREADARRIARAMFKCVSLDGSVAMRQAAIEAALAFDTRQLERLIAFVEMRDAQQRAGGSNAIPPGWEEARQDYGRWMYSIGGQPSAVGLAQRCAAEMSASMAAAGLRH